MKHLRITLLILALLVILAGCSIDLGSSSPAAEFCGNYLDDIRSGRGLAKQLLSDQADDGIMEEVLDTLEYKLLSEETQEDGSILCTLEITAIDMELLLEDLPRSTDSKEAAHKKMLDRADDATRTTREATLLLIPSDDADGFEVQYGSEFINAITGGMLDLLAEAFEMEVAE